MLVLKIKPKEGSLIGGQIFIQLIRVIGETALLKIEVAAPERNRPPTQGPQFAPVTTVAASDASFLYNLPPDFSGPSELRDIKVKEEVSISFGDDIVVRILKLGGVGKGSWMRVGIECPSHMQIARRLLDAEMGEVKWSVLDKPNRTKELPDSTPLVSVSFCDSSFTPEEIELVPKYLSAVYRESEGSGLRMVKGRQMEPAAEVVR